MSFNSTTPRAEYTATTSQTVFPFLFKIYLETDIKVYQTPVGDTPEDATDILTINTDYTVTINGDAGGEITLVSGATLNDTLVLLRDLPITRSIEYQTNGDLLAETINDDQEYQTYLILDRDYNASRVLTLPSTDISVDSNLPKSVDGGYLKLNVDGTAFEYVDNLISVDEAVSVTNIAQMLTIDPEVSSQVTVAGYYEIGDGGGGIFNYDASQSAVNDGGIVISGRVRQDIKILTPRMFGAKGDGSTDDTTNLRKLVSYVVAQGGYATINGEGLNYLISGSLNFGSTTDVILENFNIKMKDGTPVVNEADSTLLMFSVSNYVLRNIIVDGNRDNRTPVETSAQQIKFKDCHNVLLENVTSNNAVVDGFYFDATDKDDFATHPSNVTMINCVADNGFRQGISIIAGHRYAFKNCEFTNTNGTLPEAGMDFEPNADYPDNSITNVIIHNCKLTGNSGSGIDTVTYGTPKAFTIERCEFSNNEKVDILISVEDMTIRDCVFSAKPIDASFGYRACIRLHTISGMRDILIDSCTFKDMLRDEASSYKCVQLTSTTGDDYTNPNITVSNCSFYGNNEKWEFINSNCPANLINNTIEKCSGNVFTINATRQGTKIIGNTGTDLLGRFLYTVTPNMIIKDNKIKELQDNAGLPIFQLAAGGVGVTFDGNIIESTNAYTRNGLDTAYSFKSISNNNFESTDGFNLTGDAATETVGFYKHNIKDGVRETDN